MAAAGDQVRPSSPLVLGAVVAAFGAGVRWWQVDALPEMFWNDSAEYVAASQLPWWSLERWAGQRPVLMPAVLALTGDDLQRFVHVQALVAAACWGVLAAAVAVALESPARRAVGAAAVGAFSLVWPVAMWDVQILTESTALSSLALVAAAGIWFALDRCRTRAALLVGAVALFLAARDTHVVPVALVGLAMLGAAAVRPSWRTRTWLLTGAFLVALAFLVSGSSQHGGRGRIPLEHVYAVRVLPYPERVAWFEDRGMPQADDLGAIPPALDPAGERAPFTPVPTDPRWDEWRDWLDDEGRVAFGRYVLEHPGYLISEPDKRPERVFNNGEGIASYHPPEHRDIPLVTGLLWPPTWVAALVAGIAAIGIEARRARWRGLGVVGAVLVVSAAPHGLFVWHSDGMESARHLVIAGTQVRLGALLLVLAAVLWRRPEPVGA